MYLISYDISNNRIRNKIAKELENNGQRVQYSVFECRISKTQLEKLYKKLLSLIKEEEEGSIRVYHLCMKCEMETRVIGVEKPLLKLEKDDLFII